MHIPYSRIAAFTAKIFRRNEYMKKIIALLLAVVMVFALVAGVPRQDGRKAPTHPAPAETNNESDH